MLNPYEGGVFHVTSIYGNRNIGAGNEFHSGLDLVGESSKKLIAIADGSITQSRIVSKSTGDLTWQWGNYVCLKADTGELIFYCHLSERLVSKGQRVQKGDVIGIEGSTGYSFGSHCHLEVRTSANITTSTVNTPAFTGIPNKVGKYTIETKKVISNMKYTENNKPIVCMQTQSTCYNGTSTMKVLGILWHSTGANNPNLSRYVQPSDNAPDRAEMLELLGKNYNGNDWNHIYREAGLNAWIGKLADGTVATVQTMPWNYAPWGCGAGYKGSCNNGWIQFEICEDSLKDETYFDAVYKEACELTAYLCKMYGLNPLGTVSYNGVSVPVILCHQDSYQLGVGGNHSDVYHWFKRYGKDMDDVRRDVAAIMNNTEEEEEMTKEEIQKLVAEEVDKAVKKALETSNEKVYHWWKELPKWAIRPMYAAYKAKIFAGASPSDLNVTMYMIRTVVCDARLARLLGVINFKDDTEEETKADILKELGIE